MQNSYKHHAFWINTLALIIIGLLFFGSACDIKGKRSAFVQQQLPYEESALEPIISTKTMQFHWGKHYAGYIKAANRLVKGSRFKGMSLVEIIQQIPKDSEHAEIYNNVAQAWNHEFFFEGLTPHGEAIPQGELLEKIEAEFGTFEDFLAEFSKAAMDRFGSGWVWLVLAEKQLKIVTTANADTPLAYGMQPLFVVDLWEHAYYLDYQNRRKAYVEAVMTHLVDWPLVMSRMEAFLPPDETGR